MLHNAQLYCQIACFLNNKFGKRLNSDEQQFDEIVNRLNASNNNTNTLADYVEENNWNRKSSPFNTISSDDVLHFPELTIDELNVFLLVRINFTSDFIFSGNGRKG